MKLNTMDIELNKIKIDDIDTLIDEIIYTKYWDKERNDYETPTQFNHRIKWINKGFCRYKDLAEINNTTVGYLEKISSTVGWRAIKDDLTKLNNHREKLQNAEKRKEANKTHLEIWEHNEKSIKFDLAYIGNEKKKLSAKIKTTMDEVLLSQYRHQLMELSQWESSLRRDAKEVQMAHRTALGQTNTYKDTTPDKLELEQKGELNLNQNVKIESEEEKLEKAKSYFKEIEMQKQNEENSINKNK